LIDEAQEMAPPVLSELRLMASARFDSQPLLCVVLAGDARLPDKLRREDLVPLGSRIRARLSTEYASREELLACLNHLLAGAGNASLMTPGLRQTLCDHTAGNYRILMTLAGELLGVAARRDLPVLDEKLYLEVFAQPHTKPQRRAARCPMNLDRQIPLFIDLPPMSDDSVGALHHFLVALLAAFESHHELQLWRHYEQLPEHGAVPLRGTAPP
jgi:hypothetical protein